MTKHYSIAVAATVAVLSLSFGNQVVSAQATMTSQQAYVDDLLKIEDHVNPPTIVDGPAAHATLPDYYWAANPKIRQRFAQAKAAYESKQGRPMRSVTLIAGDAGVGKTFIKGDVVDKSFGRETLFKCDLHELYDEWEKDGLVEERSDLSSGDLVINTLPALCDPEKQLVKALLSKQDSSFYVIDSLDEVHPDDYVSTLRQVVEFACQSERPFIHVVVLGRPFAFREYWQTCGSEYEPHDVELHMLHAPQFRTTGDLLVSSWNYHTWKYKLKIQSDDGEYVTMPLSDYAEWYQSGFKRTGRFASIQCEPNDDMNPDVQQTLVEVARNYPQSIPILQNLAGNSILREIIRERTSQGLGIDPQAIGVAFLKAWMDRERKANDRPAQSDPEHLGLYVGLLSKIAEQYIAKGKVDKEGFFEIHPDDTVSVEFKGKNYAFPVERTITHSGLKQVDPRQPGIPKYRFYPIWVHRVLVEQTHRQLAAVD